MYNKKLLDILSQYPDECKVIIENNINYDECDIVRIRAEYDHDANFENPILILEYEE